MRWIPVILWMGLIFIGSTDLLSSGRTSRFIGPVLRWLKPDVTEGQIRFVQMIVRKTGHLAEYAILAALILRALRDMEDRRRAIRVAILLSIAYAASDEWHQLFVPTRQGSVWDVVIDAVGAALGASLWEAGSRRCRTRTGLKVNALAQITD